jgi:hypothetical protein
MDEKNLKTPYQLFGVECGKGWQKLYTPIFEYIEEYNKDKDEFDKIQVLQCKEKFGYLRIYTNFTDDKLAKMITEASAKSMKTCEMCGKKGTQRLHDGYIYTLCDDCFKEMLEERRKIVEGD